MKVLDIDGLNYYDGKIKQTYAPLASPALTGNPTATTQTKTDNSTKLATTAFVKNNLNDYAPLASPALTGNPTSQTPSTDDNSTKIATTAYVKSNLGNYATLNGATFTGAVNGVTPTAGDDSTKLATTAYVQEELADYVTLNGLSTELGDYLPLAGGEMSGAIKFGTLAGKILDFGGTGHGNLSLQEENDHQVIYFSANTNGGYPPEGAQLILHSVDGNGGYGNAVIRVGNDGSTCKDLRMYPNGSLTWNEWSVPIVQFGDHYTYFKDGQNGHWTIFQWGTMSLTNQTSGATINNKRITFPTPFPHECQFFIGFGNWTPNERYNIHSKETTGMTFDIYNAASNPHAFEWFALGY